MKYEDKFLSAGEFPESNDTLAEDQEEYQTLQCYFSHSPSGAIITSWQFTDEQLEEIKKNGNKFFMSQMTFGRGYTPVAMATDFEALVKNDEDWCNQFAK